MNERLRELAEQADDYTDNKIQMHGEFHPDWHDIRDQKFAELIIQECLAHGKLTQSQTVANGTEEYNAGREMGIEVFMNHIKHHFEDEQ